MTIGRRTAKRQLRSMRQLMGVRKVNPLSIQTDKDEIAFFIVEPDNLAVLSLEGIRGRVEALGRLLQSMEQMRLLTLDSRETFQSNRIFYQRRLELEANPGTQTLLRKDLEHLDSIQASNASAREYVVAVLLQHQTEGEKANYLRSVAQQIRNLGFQVRIADDQDIMRFLAVYYQQDVSTERFDTVVGGRWINEDA